MTTNRLFASLTHAAVTLTTPRTRTAIISVNLAFEQADQNYAVTEITLTKRVSSKLHVHVFFSNKDEVRVSETNPAEVHGPRWILSLWEHQAASRLGQSTILHLEST